MGTSVAVGRSISQLNSADGRLKWAAKSMSFVFIFLCFLFHPCLSQDEVAFGRSIVLDDSFSLFWNNDDASRVTFEIRAETLGYVAIGFSPNGDMPNSDIFLAWVDEAGVAHFHDRYAHEEDLRSTPRIDDSQDFDLLMARENATHTVVRFSRPWHTCDETGDADLSRGDTVRLIWALHPDDGDSERPLVLPYHTKRGTRSVHLREPPSDITMPLENEVKHWDLVANNMLLPGDDHTHYWCSIFKAPSLTSKHHMIGFEPIIQAGHESYVHHMVLYECHFNRDESLKRNFDSRAASGVGERCYSPNMPAEWTHCLATNTWAWAVGSQGETLPGHVGIPIGEDFNGADFFMLETHYDNPAMKADIVDNSGIRVFYTDRVRTYDAAMMLLGSEVNFLQMIPPLRESFVSAGRCMSECTREALPESGINILNGVLHAHLAAKKIRLRHIRDGKELPSILEDGHYDFNFQASRAPPSGERLVLPGDELLVECDYSTSHRRRITFGGLSTQEEMCLAFVIYYPRVKLADCRSLPSLGTVKRALGIEDVYGEAFEKLDDFLRDIGGLEREFF